MIEKGSKSNTLSPVVLQTPVNFSGTDHPFSIPAGFYADAQIIYNNSVLDSVVSIGTTLGGTDVLDNLVLPAGESVIINNQVKGSETGGITLYISVSNPVNIYIPLIPFKDSAASASLTLSATPSSLAFPGTGQTLKLVVAITTGYSWQVDSISAGFTYAVTGNYIAVTAPVNPGAAKTGTLVFSCAEQPSTKVTVNLTQAKITFIPLVASPTGILAPIPVSRSFPIVVQTLAGIGWNIPAGADYPFFTLDKTAGSGIHTLMNILLKDSAQVGDTAIVYLYTDTVPAVEETITLTLTN